VKLLSLIAQLGNCHYSLSLLTKLAPMDKWALTDGAQNS
jgi:hypothetical protein